MTPNESNSQINERIIFTRIKQNPKGQLVLAANGMRLNKLFTEIDQIQDDAILLKKHPNIQVEDLVAIRQYANKIARGETVNFPPNLPGNLISLVTTKPVMPVTTKAKAENKSNGGNSKLKPVKTGENTKKPSLAQKLARKPEIDSNKFQTKPIKIFDELPGALTQPELPLNAKLTHYDEKLNLSIRTKNFALQIISLFRSLPKTTEAHVLGNQVLRSGTSVGAHYREATYARSQAEFISKIQSGLQELEETNYWLQLLTESGIVVDSDLSLLCREVEELTAILIATVNLAKVNQMK